MTNRTPLLKVVRTIRTFSLAESCRHHPFAWYAALCVLLGSWANYAQYKRLRPMFPDYSRYSREEGGRMMDAKRQELAEVNRYKHMVGDMRRELSRR